MASTPCDDQPFADEQATDDDKDSGEEDGTTSQRKRLGDECATGRPDDQPAADTHRDAEGEIAVSTAGSAEGDEAEQPTEDCRVDDGCENRAVGRSHRREGQQTDDHEPRTEQMADIPVGVLEGHTPNTDAASLKLRKFRKSDHEYLRVTPRRDTVRRSRRR